MQINYNENRGVGKVSVNMLPLTTIGLITFIVFLVLKLVNSSNPDFEWLTWFWVFFPLWLPWAISGAIFIIALICYLIISKRD